MKTNKPNTDAPQVISNKEIAARCATFLRSKATRCAIPLNPETLQRVTTRVGRKSFDNNNIDFSRTEIRAMVDRIYTIEGRKSDAKRATALDNAKPLQAACKAVKKLMTQKAAMKAYARKENGDWHKAFDGLKGPPRQEAIAKVYSKYVWQGTQDGVTTKKVKKTVRNGKKTSKSVKTVKGQAKSAKLIAKDKAVENLRLENIQLKAKINEIFAALQEQGVVE